MRKLLGCFFLLLTFSSLPATWAQDGRKQEAVRKEQTSAGIVLTVSADNRVRVQNAEPGTRMEVYNIVGLKLTTMRVDSADVTLQLNLPKGYYIFKIGNVVRKVVIK